MTVEDHRIDADLRSGGVGRWYARFAPQPPPSAPWPRAATKHTDTTHLKPQLHLTPEIINPRTVNLHFKMLGSHTSNP